MNTLTGKIQVDFRSSEPLYLQVARQVEQLVASGELKVGDQLPTVRELATGLRINFNTVARAYRLLDEARLISTQRGRGTYIWEKPSEETLQVLRQQTLEELAKTFLQETLQMGFTTEEIITALKAASASGENPPAGAYQPVKEE